MATNYQRGVRLEHDVIKAVEARGYDATRSAGSKGVKDVVAARRGKLLYFQCKRSKRPIGSKEWNALMDAADVAGAVPLLATREPNRPFKLFRLIARRKPRSRHKPMEPYTIE